MSVTLNVRTARPYAILIERGCLPKAGPLLRELKPAARRVCLVSDSNVAPLYARQVLDSFIAAGFEASLFTFPAGEASKRLSTMEALYGHLAAHALARTDCLAALGGGVCGDMCGFAAATYLRGVDFIQIPTSLLAQVDSSVGGKTGVDLPAGKNLVGAFWQPRAVLIDPDVLGTLPARFLADGMAEVIKAACIKDAVFFERLCAPEPPPIEELIAASVGIKRAVVERDEREAGERALLNFGHTVGHALEKLTDFQGYTHGEAVAVGMVQITRAAEAAGLTAPGTAGRIEGCLARYHLPARDAATAQALAAAAVADKKKEGDGIRLVLLHEIGKGYVHNLPYRELAAFLAPSCEG